MGVCGYVCGNVNVVCVCACVGTHIWCVCLCVCVFCVWFVVRMHVFMCVQASVSFFAS